MQTKSFELLWAFFLIIFFAIIYVLFINIFGGIPAAQSLFGHSLGVLGSLLVLMTETLYSLRKRSQSARWGRMSNWLQFHIVTGLVGPFLILLHTSWKYNGLAGIVTILMVIVVISGFFGRYIYTAIPRTADGAELAEWELEEQIREAENNITAWLAAHEDMAKFLDSRIQHLPQVSESRTQLVLGRTFMNWADRAKWKRLEKQLDPELAGQFNQMRKIMQTRNILERQKRSLAFSRRVLSIWHSLHVPVGLALFAAAAFHMGAALYYATLLR